MNAWDRFQDLLARSPTYVAEVTVLHGDGTITVRLPGGDTVRVIGDGTIGNKVFIREGRVIGDAPDLPLVQVTI